MSINTTVKLLPFEEKFINDNHSHSTHITVDDLKTIYSNLSAWNKVLIARHSARPLPVDYINNIFTDFVTLSGDRAFGDDNAMICGIALLNDVPVVVCGNEKGKEDKARHNFGMAAPEGYRKFLRALEMANAFNMPIINFIDTPGAFPGVKAEERGQSYALAKCIYDSIDSRVPMISVIVGEGGSGGALAMAVANKILMLEHAVYSVISPEGCAAILWKDASYKEKAADSQKMIAQELIKLNIIDEIIAEPIGGAHRDYDSAIENVRTSVWRNLNLVMHWSNDEIVKQREEKFLKMTSEFLA